MRNAAEHQREVIPEPPMLARIAQSEQMREFFIQMWIQNPALAKQGSARVQSLLTPLDRVEPEHQHHPMTLVRESNQAVANCNHLTRAKP